MCPGSLSGQDEVIASALLRGFGYISFMLAMPKESTPPTLLCPVSVASQITPPRFPLKISQKQNSRDHY